MQRDKHVVREIHVLLQNFSENAPKIQFSPLTKQNESPPQRTTVNAV
jgi:hypothetical protein